MIITNQSHLNVAYTTPDDNSCQKTIDSNEVGTKVLTNAVSIVKASDKVYLEESQTAKQTVTITNGGEDTASGIYFKDTMSEGATYVKGTVEIDGTAYETYDPQIGFSLPDIPGGDSVIITYEIISEENHDYEEVTNKAEITYTITDGECSSPEYTKESNTVTIALITTAIEIVKSVDKTCAMRGDTLRYTSVIKNSSITKTYMVFHDEIPEGTTFVTGSVTIEGNSYPAYDPAFGFPLTEYKTLETITITFDVVISE